MNINRYRSRTRILHVATFLLLLCGTLSGLTRTANAGTSATFTLLVDTTVDSPSMSDCMDSIDADCSLRGAISHANGGPSSTYIISIPDGYYLLNYDSGAATEDNNASGDLDIHNPNVTLLGTSRTGTIIDGNATDRVIDHLDSYSQLTIEHLTIQHGRMDDGEGGGAAIFNDMLNTLSLNDVLITENYVYGTDEDNSVGGGIFSDSFSTLTIDNSIIDDNYSDQTGGGIRVLDNTLTINNSVISNNTAADAGGTGGGIAIGNGGTININGTQIVGNDTAGRGGGLFNSGGATLTVTDTLFQGNTSSSTGGGLELYGTSTLTNVSLYDNESAQGGGAISLRNSSTLTLQNATVFNNSSTGGNGGGIYVAYGGILNLNHVTLAGNTALYPGNAIFVVTDGLVTTTNTIFASAENGETCVITSPGGWITNYYNLSTDASCLLNPGLGDIINTDPLFGIYGDHGGATYTLSLLPGSPAIDQGDPLDLATRLDQRGIPIQDGDANGSLLSDIGAFEFLPPSSFLPLILKP